MFSWVLMPCWFVTLAFLATLSVKVVAAATPTSSAVTKPAAAMATSPVVFSLMFFNGVLPGGRGSLPERTPLEAVSSRRSTVPARRESRPGLPDREFGHRDCAEDPGFVTQLGRDDIAVDVIEQQRRLEITAEELRYVRADPRH